MRVIMLKGDQRRFLSEVSKSLNMGSDQLGGIVGITGRSFRDWVSEKTLARKSSLDELSRLSGIPVPTITELREEWWSGRVNGSKAAKARFAKHGSPGTIESRRKGGFVSQKRRRDNPERYIGTGVVLRKSFSVPPRSEKLAEFIGVVLGDGGLTRSQCQITLNMKDDREYSMYVARTIVDLFGAEPLILEYQERNAIRVCVTGVNFVKILKGFGLVVGNKVKNKVNIPRWISDNPTYLLSCVRGLFDTDGGTFLHTKRLKRKEYAYFGLTYTSASSPLLLSYSKALALFGIPSYIHGDDVYIYRKEDVANFFNTISPSNTKHALRYRRYLLSRGLSS